jgi:uncharacterized protein (DUF1501 family)
MKKLDRRTFLKILGAGTAASFGTSPLLNAFADPNAASKDYFIFIHQSGGWDVTLWSDPRNRRVDIIEPATLDTITSAGITGWVDDPLNDGSGDVTFQILQKGNLKLGPAMGSLADKYARLTLVNGIAMNTVSHPDGTYFSSTGRHLAGGRPVGTSIDTLMANEFGQKNILPTVSVNFPSTFLDPQLNRAVMPLRVNDVTAVAKSITRSNSYTNDDDRDRVTTVLSNEAAELAADAYYPDSAKGMGLQFNALKDMLDPKTKSLFDVNALKAAHPKFNYNARFQKGPAVNAAFAVEAIKRGIVRCVSFQMSSCDTHNANYKDHPTILQETFEMISTLVDELDGTQFDDGSGPLAPRVHILVVSEFCRTPQINLTAGRDHYPNNSALIISSKFKGNTTFGKADEDQMLPVDQATPSFVEKRAPTPADVLATFLGAFGVDPRKYMRDGEIIKEILV